MRSQIPALAGFFLLSLSLAFAVTAQAYALALGGYAFAALLGPRLLRARTAGAALRESLARVLPLALWVTLGLEGFLPALWVAALVGCDALIAVGVLRAGDGARLGGLVRLHGLVEAGFLMALLLALQGPPFAFFAPLVFGSRYVLLLTGLLAAWLSLRRPRRDADATAESP